QNGRTIPEGLLQKVPSLLTFEEEEIITNPITESTILDLMNSKIQEREITNQKTIKAIHDVSSKCKAIGTTDLVAAENFVIKVVEEKMSKLGQKQKVRTDRAKSSGSKPIRTEMTPEWVGEEEKPKDESAVMNEVKFDEFKNIVLQNANKLNKTIDIEMITLDNHLQMGTYTNLGFSVKEVMEIFKSAGL
ncbi:hypothetical protein ACTFOB_25675, partial [Bacillus cereus group sp. MYBK79-1]